MEIRSCKRASNDGLYSLRGVACTSFFVCGIVFGCVRRFAGRWYSFSLMICALAELLCYDGGPSGARAIDMDSL